MLHSHTPSPLTVNHFDPEVSHVKPKANSDKNIPEPATPVPQTPKEASA